MKLSDYDKIDCKIERLTQFIDDNSEWQNDYIDCCPDFINGYDCILTEGELYLDTIEDYIIKDMVKKLIDNNKKDLIFDACKIELTQGIQRVDDELNSFSLGEIELQLTGLSDNKTECIYTELIKDMSEDDIKQAQDNAECYVDNDNVYIDRSYDRVSLILDYDLLIDVLTK